MNNELANSSSELAFASGRTSDDLVYSCFLFFDDGIYTCRAIYYTADGAAREMVENYFSDILSVFEWFGGMGPAVQRTVFASLDLTARKPDDNSSF